MAFSRAYDKIRAIKIKQNHCHLKLRNNSEYKLKHVAEARDAALGKYALADKRIKEETELAQLRNEKFREKLHAK